MAEDGLKPGLATIETGGAKWPSDAKVHHIEGIFAYELPRTAAQAVFCLKMQLERYHLVGKRGNKGPRPVQNARRGNLLMLDHH